MVTGANGSGKSSLYRALRLLADIAQGRIIQSLAAEGGLHSTLWAGPESFSRAMKKGEQPVQGTVRKASVSLKLGFAARTMATRSISACPFRPRRTSCAIPASRPKCQWAGERWPALTLFAVAMARARACATTIGDWRQVA